MKQKLKYLIIICLLTVMMFSLTACGNKENENISNDDKQVVEDLNEESVETKKVKEEHPEWFNQQIDKHEARQEEVEELEKMLKDIR